MASTHLFTLNRTQSRWYELVAGYRANRQFGEKRNLVGLILLNSALIPTKIVNVTAAKLLYRILSIVCL